MSHSFNRWYMFTQYFTFLMMGMVFITAGTILPYLMEEYGLSYSLGGVFLAMLSAGNLIGYFFGGLSDRLGEKPMLLAASLFFVVGYGVILLTSFRVLLFVMIFFVGIGFGILNSVIHTLVNNTGRGDGRTMNLLHMVFALGAFLTPMLVGMAVRSGLTWKYAVGLVVTLSGLLFLSYLRMPVSKPQKRRKEANQWEDLFADKRIFLFMAILFFYVGAENGINGWVVTYIIDSGVLSTDLAPTMLSSFWFAIILGRIFWAFLSKRISNESILLVSCAGGMLFFLLFLLFQTPMAVFMLVAGMGLFLSAMFPITIANAGYLIRGKAAGSGFILAGASVGGALIPYFTGLAAQNLGMRWGMSVIFISGFITLILVLFNHRIGRLLSCSQITGDRPGM